MNRRDFMKISSLATVSALTTKAIAAPAQVDKPQKALPKSLQDIFNKSYIAEYNQFSSAELEATLARGSAWNLASTLKRGGIVTFPHVHFRDCAPIVAAAVQACLDSGADQVLAFGVLHPFMAEAEKARIRVQSQQNRPEDEPLRGIFGTDLPDRDPKTWKKDHSLYDFKRLLIDAANIRGIKAPKVIERYPHLTGAHPQTMPGINELKSIAKDSVIVSSADHCHHGLGYGFSPQEVYFPDEQGIAAIRHKIETALHYLDKGDYLAYMKDCFLVTHSDWRDAGPIIHYIRDGLETSVLNIVASDFTELYGAPPPTWVAGCLVKLEPKII